MSTTKEPSPPAAPSEPFDETLHRLWREHGKSVIIGCVAVLLAILANGVWDYIVAQKEFAVRQEYAATTPEKLQAFATSHRGHVLAGVARLRLADEAYAAGKGAEAVSAYEAALPELKGSPLADRARLGLAMALIQAGRVTDGETALKNFVGQPDAAKGLKAEAAYHLASLAHTAGRTDDVGKYADQLMQIDAASPWAQRVMMLRLQTPAAATLGANVPELPATTAPVTEEPAIKLNLPTGK
jgi:predicted negative regulator of RcsB-dependent stress response